MERDYFVRFNKQIKAGGSNGRSERIILFKITLFNSHYGVEIVENKS